MLKMDLIRRFSNLTLSSSNNSLRNFNYGLIVRCFSVDIKSTSNTTSNIPPPPKRSSNVFALFVRDFFRKMPSTMPVKERFALAGQEWRQLSPEQKEHYQKMSTEDFVKYKNSMNNYLSSLSEEEMVQYKQMKKQQNKAKNRQRIKQKLRELNYPKRSVSSYIFFIRDNMQKEYPDGNYPPVRTPEHLELVRKWSQQWHKLTEEERKPYEEKAEADKKRYFEELEQWKQELAKPENEEKFKQLERLSKKMEVANLPEAKAKKREKRQRRIAAKIIKKRLMAKAAAEAKEKRKAAAAAKKKKKSASSKKKATKKTRTKKSTKENVDESLNE